MAHADAVPIVEKLLDGFAHRLMDSDEKVTDLMTQTNAFGWGLDVFEDLRAWFDVISNGVCT